MREFKEDIKMRELLENSPRIDDLREFMRVAGYKYLNPDLYLHTDSFEVALHYDPDWVKWADGKGLLQKKQSIIPDTVHLGDLFQIDNNEWFMLAQVEYLRVALIGLNSGNRLTEPISVYTISSHLLRNAVLRMVDSAQTYNEVTKYRRK